jgi:hypothetical protein
VESFENLFTFVPIELLGNSEILSKPIFFFLDSSQILKDQIKFPGNK